MKDHSKELVEVSGELRQETALAYGVFTGDYSSEPTRHGQPMEILVWLPKSQCEKGDNATTWLIPQWLCREKGLD